MPNLSFLLKGNPEVIQVIGNAETDIQSLTMDSRKAAPGVAFFALRGVQADGHNFIPQAIAAGASVIICETVPENAEKAAENATIIQVKSAGAAMGFMASAFYDDPSKKLKLVGVTGTNGKTTCVTLLHKLFRELGYPVGLLSTVQNQINETIIPATHTTPDAITLNNLLADMVKAGCTHCFMEVSSHALVQHRVTGLDFAGALFTNITHDHLDYHETFDEYIRAKKLFFDNLTKKAFALVNADDKRGAVMLQNTKAKSTNIPYGKLPILKLVLLDNSIQGLHLEIDGKEIWFSLIGTFNAYNFYWRLWRGRIC